MYGIFFVPQLLSNFYLYHRVIYSKITVNHDNAYFSNIKPKCCELMLFQLKDQFG